jgi:hypothetical protein
LEVDGWWFLIAEMRRRSAAADEHPGGSALNIAMSATVQPGSSRCSAFIAKPLPLDGYEPEPNKTRPHGAFASVIQPTYQH